MPLKIANYAVFLFHFVMLMHPLFSLILGRSCIGRITGRTTYYIRNTAVCVFLTRNRCFYCNIIIPVDIHLAWGPGYFFPCPLWSSLAIRTILWRFLSFFFLHFFVCFLFVLCLSFFLTAVVSGLPECVCCVCRIQYEDMTLHCLPLLPRSRVVSLCRIFVTTELVSL